MPAPYNLITEWCRRNRFPLGAAVAPDSPLAYLREDIASAFAQLVADVESALESLDAFDRDIIHDLDALQTLHSNVRAAIDDAFREFHYQTAQASRRFK